MAKKKSAEKKKSPAKKPEIAVLTYPVSPHVVGVDWLELRVARPALTAAQLAALGFSLREGDEREPMLALGGVVVKLRRGKGRLTGVVLQVAVDQIRLKREQMIVMRLKPGAMKRSARGDATFDWKDENGLTLRFVGPVRLPSDPRRD